MTPSTARAPAIAAPIIGPTEGVAAGGAAGPVMPTAAIGLGEDESVGPGVSVGVTEGDAPIRRLGVGLGVCVDVCDGVTDNVGVGL